MTRTALWVTLGAALLAAGCATTTRIPVTATVGPRQDVEGVTVIGIGEVRDPAGRYGTLVSSKVASALMSRGRGRFDVVDRNHMQALLAEQSLQLADLTETSASEYARVADVDAIVLGELVWTSEIVSQTVPEERLDIGKLLDGDPDTKTVYVEKKTMLAGVTVAMSMIDKKGYTIISKTVSRQFNSEADRRGRFFRGASRSADELPAEGAVIDNLVDQCVEEFCKELLPYTRTDEVEVLADNEQLRRGVEFLRAEQLDMAQEQFEQALAADPASDKAVHNIGVVYELRDDHRKALTYYQRALRMKPAVALYKKACRRASEKLDQMQ